MYKQIIFLLLTIITLVSCSENNELEGKWEIINNEPKFLITFKDGEVFNTLFIEQDTSKVLYSKSREGKDLYFTATNTEHSKYLDKVRYTIYKDTLTTYSESILLDSKEKKNNYVFIRVK